MKKLHSIICGKYREFEKPKKSYLLVTSDFLQRAASATSNEQILKRVTSDFLQRATSVTSNERILQRVTSDIKTINEQ